MIAVYCNSYCNKFASKAPLEIIRENESSIQADVQIDGPLVMISIGCSEYARVLCLVDHKCQASGRPAYRSLFAVESQRTGL